MSKVLDIKDPKNLELTYQNFKTYTPLNAEVTVEGGKNILNFVLEKNKRKDIGEYIDETIHEELRDSGFFEEINW